MWSETTSERQQAATEPIGGEKIMSIWIDSESINITGDVGFLIRYENFGGSTCYSLDDRPAHTNGSHEPRLDAWCGDNNNRGTYADGLARVARTAKNGRVCLARVQATAALLEELGYPELADDDMNEKAEADSYDKWLVAMRDAGLAEEIDGAADSVLRRSYAASVALLS